MEILIVHGIDPYATKPGGTRSYILNLIDYLKNKNIKISLAAISSKKHMNKSDYDFIQLLKTSEVSSVKFFITLCIKSVFLRISKKCIILTNRADNMLPFILFFHNNPKVCVLHGLDKKKIELRKGKIIGLIYNLIEHISLKYSDIIICVDSKTHKYYSTRYPSIKTKMKIIHVGIDLESFKPMDKKICRLKYSFPENEKIIMYVGRLEKEKNIEFIFFSLQHVYHKNMFVMVGNGNNKNFLHTLASSLKVNTYFAGTVPQEKLSEILNCADVLVISSLFESGPLVVQEAIACGIPVVTVDVGRVKEFITNEKIGIICNRNINEFANAIDKLLENNDKSLIDYRRTLAQKFSFQRTGFETLKLLKCLIIERREKNEP
ncbi:MAG: glycosyltransferase family 4 protein [Candidatus Methanoperedenaceae archaeon]|nr:glycosyltransferase family 4 protein [Candidatus Methanoperedenaceae archaeon]